MILWTEDETPTRPRPPVSATFWEGVGNALAPAAVLWALVVAFVVFVVQACQQTFSP